MMRAVGLAGLGRIGRPMAERILAAGFSLVVYDVMPEAVAPLVAAGAQAAASPADLACRAGLVITCVPGPAEVEALYFGPGGVLSTALHQTIFVETSTIDAALSRRIGAACGARGLRYVDAPISGGTDGAKAGALTIMAGGDPAAIDAARPVLATFAERVVRVGPTGAGHIVKLLNQMAYLGYVALVCEATLIGDAYGIPREAFFDVLRTSVGGHPLTTTHWEERLISGDRMPGFQIARVVKDLCLGVVAGDDAGCELPIAKAALCAFEQAAATGHAGDDMTVIAPRADC